MEREKSMSRQKTIKVVGKGTPRMGEVEARGSTSKEEHNLGGVKSYKATEGV